MSTSGLPDQDTADRAYSTLVYRVRNLGDMIQTAALSRLLPPTAGVFRHRLHEADEHRPLVVNGLLHKERPPKQGPTCLFAGASGPFWREQEYLQWMARSPYPIGARDQFTVDAARSAGLDTVFIGCATMTLPRYEGPRAGVYSVDYDGPGDRLTHRISRRDTVATQWSMAIEMLSKYRTAEAVYTSRLHVALPCLAFGTPVWIASPRRAWKPERFSIVKELGLRYETLVTADISEWVGRYVEFLESHLNISIVSETAKMPAVADAARDAPSMIIKTIFRDL